MMMGIVAQQPEPHTWRGAEAVAGSGGLSSSGAFSPFGLMSARFAGAGLQVSKVNYYSMRANFAGAGSITFKATNLLMSATYVGAGQFFLQSVNANLLRKGGVGWAGASTMIANGTIV